MTTNRVGIESKRLHTAWKSSSVNSFSCHCSCPSHLIWIEHTIFVILLVFTCRVSSEVIVLCFTVVVHFGGWHANSLHSLQIGVWLRAFFNAHSTVEEGSNSTSNLILFRGNIIFSHVSWVKIANHCEKVSERRRIGQFREIKIRIFQGFFGETAASTIADWFTFDSVLINYSGVEWDKFANLFSSVIYFPNGSSISIGFLIWVPTDEKLVWVTFFISVSGSGNKGCNKSHENDTARPICAVTLINRTVLILITIFLQIVFVILLILGVFVLYFFLHAYLK